MHTSIYSLSFLEHLGKKNIQQLIIPLSKLTKHFLHAYCHLFKKYAVIIRHEKSALLNQLIIAVSGSSLKTIVKSDRARLIASLSSSIIRRSTHAIKIISIATYYIAAEEHKNMHFMTADAQNVQWQGRASATVDRSSRWLCYYQFSSVAKCNFPVCPEPLSVNRPQEDKEATGK